MDAGTKCVSSYYDANDQQQTSRDQWRKQMCSIAILLKSIHFAATLSELQFAEVWLPISSSFITKKDMQLLSIALTYLGDIISVINFSCSKYVF